MEINALAARLIELDEAYYDHDTQLVPDTEYNALTRQYRKATGNIWMKMGTPAKHLASVTHTRPMLSLVKTNSKDELDKALPKGADFVITPKIDGLALELRYEKGRLIQAVTRGDGTTGEDVTQSLYQGWSDQPGNMLTLTHPLTTTVRGECYTRLDDFDAINAIREGAGDKPFKNWRSAAGGLLRGTDDSEAKQYLRFIAYDAEGDGTRRNGQTYMGLSYIDLLKFLSAEGFTTPEWEWLEPHDIERMTWGDLEALEERLTTDFACDGLVLRVTDWSDCQRLGISSSSPRYAIALKFESEEAETTITAIEWNATRTGRVVPTYLFTPVELMNTEVKRATGHNCEQLLAMGAGMGARVVVSKNGDIIPGIVRLVTPGAPPEIPDTCPTCAAPVTRSGPDLLCDNAACTPKLTDLLTHMADRKRLDIDGLGASVAEAVVATGLVQTPSDLFRLQESALAALLIDNRAFGEKRAQKLVAQIESAQQKPWLNVLYSLGCDRLGHPEAMAISTLYGLEELLSMAEDNNLEPLTAINGIGPTKAALFLAWIIRNKHWLTHLFPLGLNLRPEALPETGTALAGKTLALTGAFSVPKHILEKQIRDAGGTIAGSVSGTTDYLVAAEGETGSSKYKKAIEKGIPVIGEAELIGLVQ